MQEWELSYDGGATSKPLRATRGGKKTVSGEKPDIDICQHNSMVLANETYTDWTNWVPGKTGK